MEKSYIVTCKKCKAERKIRIFNSPAGQIIDWLDNNSDPQKVKIISGRPRLDGLWGWQCMCGNNDLMTQQERKYLNPQAPDPKSIEQVTKNIKLQTPQFEMREL